MNNLLVSNSSGHWQWKGGNAISVEEMTKSNVVVLTENFPYFELAGHRLELQNHGRPQCPDIALYRVSASRTKPQAWSKEINGQEHWFYNYPGACAEAKFLGKKVPTIEQWIEMLASVPGNAEEKAQALNIPIVGYRDAAFNGFSCIEVKAELWSSSSMEGDEDVNWCVILQCNNAWANRYWSNREHGMLLRFLSDKN